MKRKIVHLTQIVITVVILVLLSFGSVFAKDQLDGESADSENLVKTETEKLVNIYYQTHVENIGWQGFKSNGETSGTTNGSAQSQATQLAKAYMNRYYPEWYSKFSEVTRQANLYLNNINVPHWNEKTLIDLEGIRKTL
jgi:hypothetical protein